MKIQIFSILAGTAACNARCPFCISKMTVSHGIKMEVPEVDWIRFRKACRFAQINNVSTVMITSKGEPTLFPEQITQFLEKMEEFDFPFIEIQTNGIPIIQNPEKYTTYLEKWYQLGLTLVAISIVHYDPEKNHQIYLPYKKSYIDLPGLINLLHNYKFSVRLACVMLKDFIDSPQSLSGLIKFAQDNKVEQLTVRPVNKPDNNQHPGAYQWVEEHSLGEDQIDVIQSFLEENGHKLMTLMHGATIYDVSGQNVCLTHSLTIDPSGEDIRQLIFFPDGHLYYDWQWEGARLL